MKPGFTLIELLVVLVIVSICVSVALPAYTRAQGNNHALNTAERYSAAIRTAAREAIRHGKRVDLFIDDSTVSLPAAVDVLPARAHFALFPNGAAYGDSIVIRHDTTRLVLTVDVIGQPHVAR